MSTATNTDQYQPVADEELWDEHKVAAVTGLSRSARRRMIIAGTFPAPIVLGALRSSGKPGRIAWFRSEVQAWVRAQASCARVTYTKKQPADATASAGA